MISTRQALIRHWLCICLKHCAILSKAHPNPLLSPFFLGQESGTLSNSLYVGAGARAMGPCASASYNMPLCSSSWYFESVRVPSPVHQT